MTLPDIAAMARRSASVYRSLADPKQTLITLNGQATALSAAAEFDRIAEACEPKNMTEEQKAAYELGRLHAAQHKDTFSWITGKPHET